MLSKGFGVKNQRLIKQLSRDFTRQNAFFLHRMFNVVDKGTTAYSMAQNDPVVPLQGHKPLYATDEEPTYRVTNLNNGFTVLTES